MKHALNFEWSFIPSFSMEYTTSVPKNATLVDLPHNMVDFPFNYFDEKSFQIIGTYAKEITISNYSPHNQYMLCFEGINNQFDLYINGNHIGCYTRPYMEVQIDITASLKEGLNLLVLKVNGSEAVNAPPFGNTVDFLPFSGIYREVSLHIYEPLDLISIKIDARQNGLVTLSPYVRNLNNVDYEITYQVFDDLTLFFETTASSFKIDKPLIWTLNDPHLYYLRVKLSHGGNDLYYGYPFGFRDLLFTEESFYLNGVKTPLVGLNRHETFPYLGGAATSYLQFSDVVALKELGVNYVRCSHYPPSRHFLDACDYLGLLVINEVPGWQYIGDEKWQTIHLQNIETMITRDYNHPSIIAWSIRINESVDHPMYEKGQALAKKLDPYRPTTGTRNFANSEPLEDIYSYNDFSHDGTNRGLEPKKKITKSKKPYIVSENNGHMYPTKPFDNPLILESHTKRHLAVLDAFFKNQDMIGISPWCMHDYYTHKEFGSGDKICYHGILDSFRHPKPAAYAYMANFSEKPVLFPLFKGDNGDLPESRLYETMVLSNANHLKIFKNGVLLKTHYPRKDLYKNLPNPPFILDTFVSEDFISNITFSKKDRKRVAKLLNFAATHNFNRLSIGQKIRLGLLILKYRIKRDDLVDLWTQNIAAWGYKSAGYELVGYDKKGKEVARTQLNQTTTTSYQITCHKDELRNGDTYDMTMIHIESTSPLRNTYDFSPVNISTTGPIKLVGPLTQTLHAGCLTLYIRSVREVGSATITISVQNTTKSFNLTVK
ncbi:MAG: glycoside hydrolase family 2 TIM barrel-domain containing protein [Bacilli bacterium]